MEQFFTFISTTLTWETLFFPLSIEYVREKDAFKKLDLPQFGRNWARFVSPTRGESIGQQLAFYQKI